MKEKKIIHRQDETTQDPIVTSNEASTKHPTKEKKKGISASL